MFKTIKSSGGSEMSVDRSINHQYKASGGSEMSVDRWMHPYKAAEGLRQYYTLIQLKHTNREPRTNLPRLTTGFDCCTL